ncbi:MAG: PEP-CTERM sorting domain-containing protein [Proteobacteria bacterium]|nr:PEP-CTERM sorting domain-containing protein [Pseudomonadota bacterium]
MDSSSHSITMSWVVSNVDDNNVSSYLLIDNIQITTVPESETYAMLLVGLGLIGYMLRNRKTVII